MNMDFNSVSMGSPSFGSIKLSQAAKAHIENTFMLEEKKWVTTLIDEQSTNPADIFVFMQKNGKRMIGEILNPLTGKHQYVKQNIFSKDNVSFLEKLCQKADNIWFLKAHR